MSKPFISIVTITRNNLSGLIATGKSIAEQSCHDFEWIIIDGDSGDGTKEYLLSVNAISVSEPDAGIYDAMNKGAELAKGEYTLFLNAGDRLSDPDVISLLKQSADAGSPCFIYGDALEENGHYKKARSHNTWLYGMFTHHQAMIYRTALLKNLRYETSFRIAGDYDLTMRFLCQAEKISYGPFAFCYFESGGISQKHMALGRKEQFLSRHLFGIPFWKNAAVYTGQSAAAFLRMNFPRLYAQLRFRRSGS